MSPDYKSLDGGESPNEWLHDRSTFCHYYYNTKTAYRSFIFQSYCLLLTLPSLLFLPASYFTFYFLNQTKKSKEGDPQDGDTVEPDTSANLSEHLAKRVIYARKGIADFEVVVVTYLVVTVLF